VEAMLASMLKEFPPSKVKTLQTLINVPKLQNILLNAMYKDAYVAAFAYVFYYNIIDTTEFKIIINYVQANSQYKVVEAYNKLATYFFLPPYRPTLFARKSFVILIETFNLSYVLLYLQLQQELVDYLVY
jgi:hypothetical protein